MWIPCEDFLQALRFAEGLADCHVPCVLDRSQQVIQWQHYDTKNEIIVDLTFPSAECRHFASAQQFVLSDDGSVLHFFQFDLKAVVQFVRPLSTVESFVTLHVQDKTLFVHVTGSQVACAQFKCLKPESFDANSLVHTAGVSNTKPADVFSLLFSGFRLCKLFDMLNAVHSQNTDQKNQGSDATFTSPATILQWDQETGSALLRAKNSVVQLPGAWTMLADDDPTQGFHSVVIFPAQWKSFERFLFSDTRPNVWRLVHEKNGPLNLVISNYIVVFIATGCENDATKQCMILEPRWKNKNRALDATSDSFANVKMDAKTPEDTKTAVAVKKVKNPRKKAPAIDPPGFMPILVSDTKTKAKTIPVAPAKGTKRPRQKKPKPTALATNHNGDDNKDAANEHEPKTIALAQPRKRPRKKAKMDVLLTSRNVSGNASDASAGSSIGASFVPPPPPLPFV